MEALGFRRNAFLIGKNLKADSTTEKQLKPPTWAMAYNPVSRILPKRSIPS
jgi:hypothetical protein